MSDVQHLDDDCLQRYHLGQIDEDELERVEAHLAVCGYCRERADNVEKRVTVRRFGATGK